MLSIEKIEKENRSIYILAKSNSDEYIYVYVRNLGEWRMKVEGSTLYIEGSKETRLLFGGVLTKKTRWCAGHGDIYIMNISMIGFR